MQDQIKNQLEYNPDTGVFTWRVAKGNIKPGDVAGTTSRSNYVRICVGYQSYRAHRLAWLFMTGNWPTAEIDHINGNVADNRFSNLRECSRRQNMANTKKKIGSAVNLKGVCRHPHHPHRFLAQIRLEGKVKYLGVFDDKEAAHAAYVEAAKQQFGEFYSAG